jgi:hypothetical protein
MKAKMKAQIERTMPLEIKGEKFVGVHLDLEGSVEQAKSPDAKQSKGCLILALKPLAAQELHIGQTLYVEVSTEE